MDQNLFDFLKGNLAFPGGLGRNKVMDLSEAVQKFVKSGMSIQTGNGMAFPTNESMKYDPNFMMKRNFLLDLEVKA